VPLRLSLPDAALSILAEGRQVHLAVPSKHGPHVTPDLYGWSDDRLWFAVAASTLKAKVLRRDPTAGAVVSVAGSSVVLRGPVERFDLFDPVGLARGACSLPRATRALAGYTVRNAADLLAFARDTASGRLGRRLPPRRVLFSLAPTGAAVVENDEVADRLGTWPVHTSAVRRLPTGGEPAVAAFPGLLALPGRWFPDDLRLHLNPALLAAADVDGEFEMSVVVDRYSEPGPTAKEGTLVRGTGRVTAPGVVTVDPDLLVGWDGVATEATPA
jgi:hypothetical protein